MRAQETTHAAVAAPTRIRRPASAAKRKLTVAVTGPTGQIGRPFVAALEHTPQVGRVISMARRRSTRPGMAGREAMVGGIAHSGRVLFAAGAVMVAVFFTFALSGPLPPKEVGVILGVAVLLDAALIRLLRIPVLLPLLGSPAWHKPRWAHRTLPDVRFGHARSVGPHKGNGSLRGRYSEQRAARPRDYARTRRRPTRQVTPARGRSVDLRSPCTEYP